MPEVPDFTGAAATMLGTYYPSHFVVGVIHEQAEAERGTRFVAAAILKAHHGHVVRSDDPNTISDL